MPYTTEFPGFPAADIPAFVQGPGWADRSWRNEAAPFFVHEISGLAVWVNRVDPLARPIEMQDRFSVARMQRDPAIGWVWGADIELLYAGDSEREALAVLIGEHFPELVRGYVGEARFAEMQRRNIAHPGDGVCSSHDFCDANVFMAEAFESIASREPVTSYETGETEREAQSEEDCALWNLAWSYAKPRHLTARSMAA